MRQLMPPADIGLPFAESSSVGTFDPATLNAPATHERHLAALKLMLNPTLTPALKTEGGIPRRKERRGRATVLVVEPSDAFRETLADLLHDLGYRVWTAPDLEAGLQCVRHVDVAVLSADAAPIAWSARTLRREHPDAQVLVIGESSSGVPGIAALPKPLDIRALDSLLRTSVAFA